MNLVTFLEKLFYRIPLDNCFCSLNFQRVWAKILNEDGKVKLGPFYNVLSHLIPLSKSLIYERAYFQNYEQEEDEKDPREGLFFITFVGMRKTSSSKYGQNNSRRDTMVDL